MHGPSLLIIIYYQKWVHSVKLEMYVGVEDVVISA